MSKNMNNTGYFRLGDFFLDNIPAINLTSIKQLEALLGFSINGSPQDKPAAAPHSDGCLCGYCQDKQDR